MTCMSGRTRKARMTRDEPIFSLSGVVCLALEQEGDGLLERPEVLKGYLSNYLDFDSMEFRVLGFCCDRELLASYAACVGGGAQDIQIAAMRARDYLENAYFLNSSAARVIADGIAAGVATWCGVSWEEGRVDEAVPEAGPVRAEAGGHGRRLSSVPGIFVDARERVHISAIRIDEQPSVRRFSIEVCELRDLRRRLDHLFGRGPNERMEVIAAASDLTFPAYQRIHESLSDANIHVERWIPPTSALAVGWHSRVWPQTDCHILAVHLGASRCALGIYDHGDGVYDCTSVVRADVDTDLYRRQSAAADLVVRAEREYVDYKTKERILSSGAWGGTIYVCVMDELGHGTTIEDALRVSLAEVVADSWTIEFRSSETDDIAKGLALRGGVLSGDVEGMLSLDATWFDVLLEGPSGIKLLLEHGTTMPTSKTETVLIGPANDDGVFSLGESPALILADTTGEGLRLPLPRAGLISTVDVSQEVDATIDIDANGGCKLTLMLRRSGKMQLYVIDDLLQYGKRVTIRRKAGLRT